MVIFKLNATKFEKVGAIGSVSHLVMSNSLQLHGRRSPDSSNHHPLLELAQTHAHRGGDAIPPLSEDLGTF